MKTKTQIILKTVKKFHKREELKNIVDEHFWHYYRLNKSVRPKTSKRKVDCLRLVAKIFKTMQELLTETDYGIYLKGLGVIVPKDVKLEIISGRFTREETVSSRYRFFFEDEYLSQYFKVVIRKWKKCKDSEKIREPKPYAVMLHRKKLRHD